MDSFINLAKQGYTAYSESQSDVSKTGGQEYNSPHHSGQDHNSPHHSGSGGPSFDQDEVVRTAQSHGSGEGSLFSTALGFLSDNKQAHHEPLDEEHVQDAHRKAYQEGGASGLSAGSLGSAAALQALKQFTSGGGGQSQTQLISLAMAEATKLFDKSGGAASGGKQDAVNGAAMTVMKLMVQSKFKSTTGGSSSGGLGSLMGMASKFM